MKPVSDVHELFRRQRAIRNFTDEDVPDALVDQVLAAAMAAHLQGIYWCRALPRVLATAAGLAVGEVEGQ